jgi:hypothetical protein
VVGIPDVASLIRATRPCVARRAKHPNCRSTRAAKNIPLYRISELRIFHLTRPKEEGRIAIVTNAGRTAVDVGHIGANGFAGRATVSEGVAHTTGVIGVRQNRVVLTPGVCASSVALMWVPNRAYASAIRKATGAIVHRSPGRARHKP